MLSALKIIMKKKKYKTKMESSALNVAHQQHRRAEAHLRYKRFEDAILCHRKAAEKLTEAMTLTNVPRSLESMQLQRDYHNRQIDIIRMKKERYEIYKEALETHRKKMADVLSKPVPSNVEPKDSEANNLQIAIYKAMEEADSLLDLLVRRGDSDDSESVKSDKISEYDQEDITTLEMNVEVVVAEGMKRPKDDRTVIEELRTLNQQLRVLVMQLVTQLDACLSETESLKERIRVVEAEKEKLIEQIGGTNATHKETLHVITDSLGGNSSPYVFSPCSELSPEVTETRVPRELPILAPLEMPSFDFSVFMKQQSKEDN